MSDSGYEVTLGEPYLTKDAMGKYVVLQDESMERDGMTLYFTDQLIDPDPTEEERFRHMLAGTVRESMFYKEPDSPEDLGRIRLPPY